MTAKEQARLAMLVVDDDERYVDALFRDAQRKGIFLEHRASLEEAREFMETPAGGRISGIILDVECYRRRSDETPDSSFIIAATKYFNEKAPDLPLAAITGVPALYERYCRDFADIWEVYRKGRDEPRMLDSLRERALALDSVRLEMRYADIFRIVDGYLGAEARTELLSALRSLDDRSQPSLRGALANLRSIQERMYVALHTRRPDMVPKEHISFHDKGTELKSVNLAAILDSLKGSYDPRTNKNQGKVFLHYRSTLYRFSEMVYKVSSDGIHALDGDGSGKPTVYTVQAVLFALFDLLLWFGRVMEEA